MAKKEQTNEQAEEQVSGGSKKKLILIIVGALILVGASVGTTVMLLGGEKEEETVEVDPGPMKGDPEYIELKPFTVNLDPNDPVAFLQVQIQVLSYYSEVTDQLNKHKPLIRNNLMLLFGEQKSGDLRSPLGKETLQKKVHESIQAIIDKYGNGGEIESVFFTNFVMQ